MLPARRAQVEAGEVDKPVPKGDGEDGGQERHRIATPQEAALGGIVDQRALDQRRVVEAPAPPTVCQPRMLLPRLP